MLGTLRRIVVAGLLLPLSAHAPRLAAQDGGSLPASLRADVDAGNREWIEGFKAGDAALMTRSYAPDGLFCGPTGECIKGAAAIEAHYQDVLRRFGHAASASVRSAALRVDGDLAFESGRAEARFSDGRTLQGRFSTVWKRQTDGHWKIFRNLSL